MLFDPSDFTAASINAEVDTALADADATVDALVSANGTTYDEVLAPFDDIADRLIKTFGRTGFMGYVHPDSEIRAAGKQVEERLDKWGVDVIFREDLYRAVKAYSETSDAAALEGEQARLLAFLLRDLRKAGHELDAGTRARVKELTARLVELSVEFERNIAEHEDYLELTDDDLDGLPAPFVESLDPGDEPGTYRVTMAYPHVVPFMDNSSRRDLREQLSFKFNNRAVEANRPLLAEAIAARQEIASLFGDPSWAHHQLDERMAKTPEAVSAFYADLRPALTEAAKEEIARMAALLEADTGDSTLQVYDWRYYDTLLRKTEYGVDPTAVAEYFPLHRVLAGLFEITGEVFGLRYRQVEHRAWHEDVLTYAIHDAGDDSLIAHFFMDLFPREGKFSHAAAFPLIKGRLLADGGYQKPVAAIVANFTKPTAARPSLLQHTEVETLFHEFGHILHQTLTKAETVRFSGTATERDFVEAPSQIMEHWVWKADVLARFARHHETDEPIPVDMVERLVAAKRLNIALQTLRQMSFGVLDMAFHSPEPAVKDLDAILRMANAVSLLPFHEGTFFPASFGHLLSGYDAGYYGYMWSEVYGDDMFSRFEEEGYTSPAVGRDYRTKILERGGSVDGMDLLRDFLGREPNNQAFLRNIGIL